MLRNRPTKEHPLVRSFACLLLTLFVCLTSHATTTLTNTIHGVKGEVRENVEGRLKLMQETYKRITPEIIHNLLAAAPKEIRKAIEPYGYFKARILTSQRHHGHRWNNRYYITLGPRLRIHNVKLIISGAGKHDSALQHYIKARPLRPGHGLNIAKYEKFKDKLFTLANQQGYLDARMRHAKIHIDLQRYQADVAIHFDTGPRFYFGQVHFSQTPFDRTFLKRYLPFHANAPYSESKLLVLQDRLSTSPYFRGVQVVGQRDHAHTHHVPIDVDLNMQKQQLYNFGLGYGTDTGPRASTGAEWRWLNKNGHYVTSLLSVSQIQTSLLAKYVIPGKDPLTDQYNIIAGLQNIDISKGSSFLEQLAVNQLHQFGPWQSVIALTLQHERSKLIDAPKTNTVFLLPSVTLTRVQGDKPIFPTQGSRFSIIVRGGSKDLLSKTNLFQTIVNAKYTHFLTHNIRVLLRSSAGFTEASELKDVPLSLQLFAGGSQSVRGYGFQKLGPGRYMFTASAELQHRIVGNWFLAGFYDAGNAFDHFPMELQRSTGGGVMWLSPVGPVEADLAKPLDGGEQHLHFVFNIGVDL